MTKEIINLLKTTSGYASKVKANSALNPICWLTVTAAPICFFFATLNSYPINLILNITGLAVICTGLLGFIYFSIFKPDYLRSEEFHLEKYSIELAGHRNHPKKKDDPALKRENSFKGLTNVTDNK